MADRKLSVTIVGDAKGAKKAVGDLEKSLGKAEKSAKKSGSGISSTLAGLGIGAALFGAATAFDEASKVAAQSEAVIKSTGGAAHVTAGQMNDLAGALSKKSGIDDEAIQSGENLLATFTNVRNEAGKGNDVFNQTTAAALDMSVAMGTDMKSAAMTLGKALNDPTAGLSKLTKQGVTFDAQQKNQIKTLQASGDMLGAQKVILAEVNKEFGGSAEAQATALGKARVAVDNMAESLGAVMNPALNVAADLVGGLADALGALPAPLQTVVVGAAGGGAAWLKWGDSIGDALKAAKTFTSTAGNLSTALVAIGVGVPVIYGVTRAFQDSAAAAAKFDSMVDTFATSMGEGKDKAGALAEQTKDIWSKDGDTLVKLGIGSVSEFSRVAAMGEKEFNKWASTHRLGGKIMGGLRDELDQGAAAAERGAEADRKKSQAIADGISPLNQAREAVHLLGGGNKDTTVTLQDLKDAADEAAGKIRDFYDATTSGLEDQVNVEAAIDSLSQSFKDNGVTTDVGTEKGRANTQALIDMRDAAVETATGIATATNSQDQGAASLQGYALRLMQAAHDAGATDGEVATMIATMHLTPAEIATTFKENAPQAKGHVEGYHGAVDALPTGKSLTVTAHTAEAERQLDFLTRQRRVDVIIGSITNKTGLSTGQIFAGASGGKAGPETGVTLVGEKGPELVTFSTKSLVHDAETTKAMLNGRSASTAMGGRGGGGGRNTYVINITAYGANGHQLGDVVAKALIEKQDRTGGRKILAGLA